MTKDEFVLRRLKEDAKLYKYLFPIYIAILVVFLLLDLYSIITRGPSISLGGGLIILALALQTPNIKRMRDDADAAVAEYEAYLADPVRNESLLSEQTMRAINTTPKTSKQLLGMWVAYGILTVVLFAGFVGTTYSTFYFEDGNVVLLLLCSMFLVMAIPLAFLTYKAFQDWKITKEFDKAE